MSDGLTTEETAILDALNEFFLKPFTESGKWDVIEDKYGDVSVVPHGTIGYAEPEEDEYPKILETLSGWCSRLSAPGYMDCTEWSGPFATQNEAWRDLIRTHGDSVEIEEAEELDDAPAEFTASAAEAFGGKGSSHEC
jgi:hypothetical protein